MMTHQPSGFSPLARLHRHDTTTIVEGVVMATGAILAGLALLEFLFPEVELDPRRYPTQRQKELVLERDGRACHYCGVLTTYRTRHFDHVTPHARGGPTEVWNLRVACWSCNSEKGTMTGLEYRLFG